MAIQKKDLLKFSRSTELAVKLVEDDSSENTEVKILHLVNPVTATGSVPTPDGKEMKVTAAKVYVAADNIEEMLKDTEEKDGILVYKGTMHLDVSKPSGRTQNGEFVITKPAKIWLTKVKYSKTGGNLRKDQTNSLNDMINKMFGGSQPVNLDEAQVQAEPEGKKKPEVVATKS